MNIPLGKKLLFDGRVPLPAKLTVVGIGLVVFFILVPGFIAMLVLPFLAPREIVELIRRELETASGGPVYECESERVE